MKYLNINDPVFDRTITIRQAYGVLLGFIEQYHARGESSTLNMLSDTGLGPDDTTCDPAQIYDYLRVVGKILDDDELREIGNSA